MFFVFCRCSEIALRAKSRTQYNVHHRYQVTLFLHRLYSVLYSMPYQTVRRRRSLGSKSRHLGPLMRAKRRRQQDVRGRGGGLNTLPSFARIKKPRQWPVKLSDRHLQSHGQKGDETVQCHTDNYKIQISDSYCPYCSMNNDQHSVLKAKFL